MSQSHNPVSLMRHLYQLIATKERSQHNSFMPHKYFSRLSGYSLFMGMKAPEMKAPSLISCHFSMGRSAGGEYRYCLNLSNSNIHKSLIRSQCCNQHSQQQQGSCRFNPPSLFGSVWLLIGSGGLQREG